MWPFQAIPRSLKQRLGLTRRDMGVDGLLRTGEGEVIAVGKQGTELARTIEELDAASREKSTEIRRKARRAGERADGLDLTSATSSLGPTLRPRTERGEHRE